MTTTNVAANSWSAATATPQIAGNVWQVILPITDSIQFYSLKK